MVIASLTDPCIYVMWILVVSVYFPSTIVRPEEKLPLRIVSAMLVAMLFGPVAYSVGFIDQKD